MKYTITNTGIVGLLVVCHIEEFAFSVNVKVAFVELLLSV